LSREYEHRWFLPDVFSAEVANFQLTSNYALFFSVARV
jgi:hypothetical protein